MRFRFKPNSEERAALRRQLARLAQPAVARKILHPVLPAGFKPAEVVCTAQSVHADRFVTKVQLRSASGETHAYAVKAYSDDFVARVWTHSQTLAAHLPPDQSGLCLAMAYVPEERLLIFPWIDGEF